MELMKSVKLNSQLIGCITFNQADCKKRGLFFEFWWFSENNLVVSIAHALFFCGE